MTELERRALLGDKEAQKECTEKGIVLPCPKCFKPVTVKEYDYGNIMIECECGLSFHHKSWEQIREFPKAWNTRTAPPIGRCWECKRKHLRNGEYFCEVRGAVNDDNDYCSYFKPRCEESEYGNQTVMAVENICYLPEIDPETLPIVQELREQLEQEKKKKIKIKYDDSIMTIKEICDRLRNAEQQLSIVTAERDQAVEELHRNTDAVPVVRCKDCESCEKEYTKELDVILHCGLKVALAHEKTIETSVFSNDFCSYGERK